MRGAAMKVGQLFSMIELDGLPEEQRTELESKLATLRDDVPPVPFAKLEKLMREELGAPLGSVFASFDERAFAAASIGQVHRATTLDGEEVVVKVQYPGVAEAVDSDLRSATLLLPLIKRLAPGLDAKPLFAELRERIGEELDYELEAQHQRRVERLFRGHPFITVPRVRTDLSTRRVLVSEFVEGERFEAVRALDQAQRDRYGEIVFRFFFGLLYRHRIALGDPHPGNYLLRPDGRVAFLDYGLVRDFGAARIDAERAIALAVREEDPAALEAALVAGGYVPATAPTASTPSWRCDDHRGVALVRRAGGAPALAASAAGAGARARRRRRGAPGRVPRADEPLHAAAGDDPDPPHARARGRRAQPAARERGLGRDRRRVPPRRAAGDRARPRRGRVPPRAVTHRG